MIFYDDKLISYKFFTWFKSFINFLFLLFLLHSRMTFSLHIQTVKVRLAYEKAAKAVEELKDEHGEGITVPQAIYGKAEPDKE